MIFKHLKTTFTDLFHLTGLIFPVVLPMPTHIIADDRGYF